MHYASFPAYLIMSPGKTGYHDGCCPLGGEEEEDLFIFIDTIEGPRAPAVKPGRITQVLKHE